MSPTSSTFAAVTTSLLSLFATALEGVGVDGGDVLVLPTWGPNAQDECVFLGRHPSFNDGVLLSVPIASNLATLKAGRKWRDETYTIPLTLWEFRGDLGPEDAPEVIDRLYELWNPLESVLADTPKLNIAGIKVAQFTSGELEVRRNPDGSGLVGQMLPVIEASARLT